MTTTNKKPAIQADSLTEKSVRISNTLTEANQGFKHLNEKRIIMAALAKMGDDTYDKQTKRHVVTITAREIIDAYPALANDNDAYSVIKQTLTAIQHTKFTRHHPQPDGSVWVETSYWISATAHNDKTNSIRLKFTPEATPLLLELKGKFTVYELRQAAGLRTLNAWRLLELLMQYRDTGWRDIAITDLAHAMQIQPSYLKNWAELKRRVLDPAIKELQQKEGWTITYTPIKEGVKLKRLRFDFTFDAPAKRNAKLRTKPPKAKPAPQTVAPDQAERDELERRGQLRIDAQPHLDAIKKALRKP